MQNEAPRVRVNEMRFEKHIQTLTASQRQFVTLLQDWKRQPRRMVILVSGGPGTGKTYTVVETMNFVQHKQLRLAPTARIAEKIGGRTIHSALKIAWGAGSVSRDLEKRLHLEPDLKKLIGESSILREEMRLDDEYSSAIIDEIGMLASWFSIQVVKFLMEGTQNLLLILMGDKHQLKPVKSNENLFDICSYLQEHFETHLIELTESKRFEPAYEPVIQTLREFVDKGDQTELLSFVSNTFPVVETIEAEVLKQCDRVLAASNKAVDAYNAYYLKEMVPGKIIRLFQLLKGRVNKSKYVDVKKGCLVFVTQNGCSTDVKNGTLCVFDRYDAEQDRIVCFKLIKPNQKSECRIHRNFNGMFPVAIGFAGTVHKFQGETIDDNNIAINFDGSRDLNLMYTALSRVKNIGQIRAVALGKPREDFTYEY